MHYCLLFWKKIEDVHKIVHISSMSINQPLGNSCLRLPIARNLTCQKKKKKRPLKVILKSHLICNFSLKNPHSTLRAKLATTFIFWVDMHRNFCRIRSIFTFHRDLRWENTIHLRSYLLFYHQVHNIRNKNADPRIQLHNMKMKKKEVKRDEELILFKLAKKIWVNNPLHLS